MATINAINYPFLNNLFCGRLTLTSATPVTISDVTSATTVYFTPFKGNVVPLYDGTSRWDVLKFSELSFSVPATTSTVYDVFGYNNSGVLALDNPLAWTNSTTRATNIVFQDGVYVKSGDSTRLWLGSFMTTDVSGKTEDSLSNRLLFNNYNRVLRAMRAVDTTNTWTYSTASWRQANGSTANQLNCLIGVAENAIYAQAFSIVKSSNSTARVTSTGIGVNSTTANSAQILQGIPCTSAFIGLNTATYSDILPVGYNNVVWLEWGAGADTQTWYGDNGTTTQQTGIIGNIYA